MHGTGTWRTPCSSASARQSNVQMCIHASARLVTHTHAAGWRFEMFNIHRGQSSTATAGRPRSTRTIIHPGFLARIGQKYESVLGRDRVIRVTSTSVVWCISAAECLRLFRTRTDDGSPLLPEGMKKCFVEAFLSISPSTSLASAEQRAYMTEDRGHVLAVSTCLSPPAGCDKQIVILRSLPCHTGQPSLATLAKAEPWQALRIIQLSELVVWARDQPSAMTAAGALMQDMHSLRLLDDWAVCPALTKPGDLPAEGDARAEILLRHFVQLLHTMFITPSLPAAGQSFQAAPLPPAASTTAGPPGPASGGEERRVQPDPPLSLAAKLAMLARFAAEERQRKQHASIVTSSHSKAADKDKPSTTGSRLRGAADQQAALSPADSAAPEGIQYLSLSTVLPSMTLLTGYLPCHIIYSLCIDWCSESQSILGVRSVQQ
jgi:hypothetical protein